MHTILASGFPEGGWLVTLGIGLLAGWLASIVLGRSRTGLLANLVVGVLGSFVGGYLLDFFDIHLSGFLGSVATATAGAIVLLIVLRVLYRAS